MRRFSDVPLSAANAKSSDERTHQIIKNAWLIMCVIGTAYHGWSLSDNFFAYDIVTAVEVSFPDTFVPPSFTLCFYVVNLVLWSAAEEKFSDLRTRMEMSNLTEDEFIRAIKLYEYETKLAKGSFFLNDILVKDAFALTYGPGDMFTTCSYVDTVNYTVISGQKCSTVYNITEYFKEAFKCFTFNHWNLYNYSYLAIQRIKGINGFLKQVNMHPNVSRFINDMFVSYHPPMTFPREGFTRNVYRSRVEDQLLSFTYQAFLSELLPAPYDTDCRNYNTSGYSNKGACFEQCSQKLSLERFGKIAPGTNVFKWQGKERMMSIGFALSDPDIYKTINDIESECGVACFQLECHLNYYVPQLLSSNPNSYIALMTMAQQSPNIRTVYDKKVGFIQFCTDLFSALGFWLGTSMLNVFEFMHELVAKTRTRKKARRTFAASTGPTGDHGSVWDLRREVSALRQGMAVVSDALTKYGLTEGRARPSKMMLRTRVASVPFSSSSYATGDNSQFIFPTYKLPT